MKKPMAKAKAPVKKPAAKAVAKKPMAKAKAPAKKVRRYEDGGSTAPARGPASKSPAEKLGGIGDAIRGFFAGPGQKPSMTAAQKAGIDEAVADTRRAFVKEKVDEAAKDLTKPDSSKPKAYPKNSDVAADFRRNFAAARKAGKKEFTWQGRKYTTKLKGE